MTCHGELAMRFQTLNSLSGESPWRLFFSTGSPLVNSNESFVSFDCCLIGFVGTDRGQGTEPTKEDVMALKHGDEYYTLLSHSENGKVLRRRLHKLEVQARNGQVFTLKGENLPDRISTCVGMDHKGEHLGQILLNPKKVPRKPLVVFEKQPWPSPRDLLSGSIGFFLVAIIRFIISVIGG